MCKWPCVLSCVLSGRRLPTTWVSYLFTLNTIVLIFVTVTRFVSGCYSVSTYTMQTAYLVHVQDSRSYFLFICVGIRSFTLPLTKEDHNDDGEWVRYEIVSDVPNWFVFVNVLLILIAYFTFLLLTYCILGLLNK